MRRLHRKSHSQSGRDAFGVDTTTAENVRLAEHADHDDSLGAISEVERELALLMEQEKCNKRRRSTIVPPRSTSISTMTMRDRDGREMRVVDMDDELILDNLVQHVSSLEMIAASRGSIERDASGVVHSAMTGGNDDVENLNNVDCATGSCGTAYFASIFDQVPAAMTRIPPCSDALHHLNNSESLCEADCFSNASLRATFPFLEAVQQDESWCTGSMLALTEDLLRTSVYHEAMSDAQLAATREVFDATKFLISYLTRTPISTISYRNETESTRRSSH